MKIFDCRETVVITQIPCSGYVAYAIAETEEEIGRTEEDVEAWAEENNVIVEYDGRVGSVTPFPARR